MAKPLLGDCMSPLGQRHADGDFVEPDLDWGVGANAHVVAHQHECPGGHRVAGTGRHDRDGRSVDMADQRSPICHQVHHGGEITRPHHAQIKPT